MTLLKHWVQIQEILEEGFVRKKWEQWQIMYFKGRRNAENQSSIKVASWRLNIGDQDKNLIQ